MGTLAEYKLPLRPLVIGTHKFSFRLTKDFFEQMESTDVRDGDILAEVTVEYTGDVYEIDMRCTGEVTIPCDRCLDDMQESIDAEYHIAAKYGDRYNDEDEALIEVPRSDSDLDIAHMLYDTVMLDIPIQHMHADGQCNSAMSDILNQHRVIDLQDSQEQGPQDTEGTDTPNDPRWDALKNFKTQD